MDLTWYQYTLVALGLLYITLITYYLRNLVKNKLKFLDKYGDIETTPEKWKPYVRYDYKTWSLLEMYFCAIFILPIRLILLLIVCIFSTIFSFLCTCQCQTKNKDPNTVEQSKFKRVIFTFFLNLGIRMAMFCLGVWWIPHKNLKIKDYDDTYPEEKYKEKKQTPSILIGNHIGYLEAMYFATTKYCPSYVAKKPISKLPILGALGKACQCIFVDRENQEKRNAVLENIIQRCEFIKQGKNFPPIAMFPEGTCSNGKYLLSFKKGAFEPLAPIKIFYFKFHDRHFSHYLDTIPLGQHLFLTLCQFSNKFDVFEFDTFHPDHLNYTKPEEWTDYAKKIKQIMLNMSGLKDSDAGYRDVRDYEVFLENKKVQMLAKKNSVQQLHRALSNNVENIPEIQEKQKNEQDIENQNQDQKQKIENQIQNQA